MESLLQGGGLSQNEITPKFIAFGAIDVSFF
jgi:hypothetical protein